MMAQILFMQDHVLVAMEMFTSCCLAMDDVSGPTGWLSAFMSQYSFNIHYVIRGVELIKGWLKGEAQ
jgi:hypothetical protein